MTTYNATKMAAGVQPRLLPGGAGVKVLSTFLMTVAAALATNDLVNMLQLSADAAETPAGPSIVGMILDCGRLDSGAGVVLAVGDAGAAARYISGSTIGQPATGGVSYANVGGAIGYQPFSTTFATYPTASLQTYTVVLKATTGVTTPVQGTIALCCEFTYDP